MGWVTSLSEGKPEWPGTQDLIASPPFSCGLGFLMDILLHLDIRVSIQNTDYWAIDEASGQWGLSTNGIAHFAQHVSITREKSVFAFPDKHSFLCEHRMDLMFYPATSSKALLFVRDPIDSVFSWHRRFGFAKSGLPFREYLEAVTFFHRHLPYDSLYASPLMIYAVFCLWWTAAFGENLVILRFEELKRDGLHEIRRVLREFGISRDDQEIERAIEASKFETITAKRASTSFTANNRKSKANEWRDHISEQERLEMLDFEPMKSVLSRLGYAGATGKTGAASPVGEALAQPLEAVSPVFPEFFQRLRSRPMSQDSAKVQSRLETAAAMEFTSARVFDGNSIAVNSQDFQAIRIINQVVRLVTEVLSQTRIRDLRQTHLIPQLVVELCRFYACMPPRDIPKESRTRISPGTRLSRSFLGTFLERHFPGSKRRLDQVVFLLAKLFPLP
jgi:hypothetical protein